MVLESGVLEYARSTKPCFSLLVHLLTCFISSIKDSNTEYSGENIPGSLYCRRNVLLLYKLLWCNLHRWSWQKWIHYSSEYLVLLLLVLL